MTVLPPRTEPPDRPHQRRHRPPKAPERAGQYYYQRFRSCLRWDFGFTCAFCLLHERDLMRGETEGWRVMTVEHFVPQGEDQGKINQYSNCYLCCVRCNTSRGSRSIEHPNGTLLDPCEESWGERFRLNREFGLEVIREGDLDAARTLEVYDLNDRQKVKRRKKRLKAILEAWSLLRRSLRLFDLLDPDHPHFGQGLRILQRQRKQALDSLREWKAIPDEPPSPCRCEVEDARRLPRWLADQCDELPAG